jgi:hypothetical protein
MFMKTLIRLISGTTLLLSFLPTVVSAQSEISLLQPSLTAGAIHEVAVIKPPFLEDTSSTAHLDKAVAALDKGDQATTTQELKAGIAGMEVEAQQKPTSFKDKVLTQASKLKALLPLIPNGALGNGVLGKAVALAKLAYGGNQLESILSAGSLLGKGNQLSGGLSSISTALSTLGGQTHSSGQSLLSKALGTVSKLDQGGIIAKAAEPVAKTEVSSLLNFVKGVL